MPRKAPITASKKKGLPKLWVRGSSVLTGRRATLLRIRPTVVARLEAQSYGPLYLLIEHALTELCERLEAMPDGQTITLEAEEMNPTPEDKEVLEAEAAKKARAKPTAARTTAEMVRELATQARTAAKAPKAA